MWFFLGKACFYVIPVYREFKNLLWWTASYYYCMWSFQMNSVFENVLQYWGYFMFARKSVCCLRMAWVQKSILCWKGFKGNETSNKKTNKFGFTIEEMIDHKTNALYVPIWFHRLCKREESIQTQKNKTVLK